MEQYYFDTKYEYNHLLKCIYYYAYTVIKLVG